MKTCVCANGNIPETAGETHRLGGQALSVELPQLKEHCLPSLGKYRMIRIF